MATRTANRPPLADQADRDITPKTKHYADWLHSQTGAEVEPASVQLALALDKIYRGSDEYVQFVAEGKAAREQAERERREGVIAKRREAAEKAMREAQERLAKLGVAPAAESTPAPEKAPAKKAAPAKRPAAKNTAAKKAAPAKKTTAAKKSTAAKASTAPASGDAASASSLDEDF